MLLNKLVPAALLSLCSLAVLAGCSSDKPAADDTKKTTADDKKKEVDPHDVPLTEAEISKLKAETAKYADALSHIQKYKTTIQESITAGTPEKGHRALDNLDVVLERLPEAAQNSKVPKDNWQAVNEASQALRDAFNKLHEAIDAGEKPDYAAAADGIDAKLRTLTELKPAE